MKLSNEQAREFTYGVGDPALGLEVESDEYTGSGRWESHHFLVLKDREGKFWGVTYGRGLTEYQDSRPFEDDGDEIEFTRVEKVPVTTYEYREVSR